MQNRKSSATVPFYPLVLIVLAAIFVSNILQGQNDSTVKDSIKAPNIEGTFQKKILPGAGVRPPTYNDPVPKKIRECFHVHIESKKTSDKCGLMTNRTEIYPGNIFTGINLLNGAYTMVQGKRNPATISMQNILFQNPKDNLLIVKNPSSISLNNAIMELIMKPKTGKSQADIFLETNEIYSQADVEFNLDIHARNFLGDFKVGNSFSFDQKKSSVKLMISFIQKYFTVVADVGKVESIFQDNTEIDDNMTYIRSVTYGRRGFLLVEIDTSITEIKNKFNVAKKRRFSVDADFYKSKEFSSAKVVGYIFGGSAVSGAKVLSNNDPKVTVTEFFDWIQASAEFNENNYGRPIEYEIAFVKTNELASIEYFINQTKKYCEEGDKYLRVELKSIEAVSVDDHDEYEDIYGILAVYFHTQEKKVSIPPNRFCVNKENSTNCFYNGNGKAADAYIALPEGGLTPLQSGHYLWRTQRSQHVNISKNRPLNVVGKYCEFVVNSMNHKTSKLIIFGNLDEADRDDPDDRLDRGNDEYKEVTLETIIEHFNKPRATTRPHPPMRVYQDFKSGGTIVRANYEITLR